MKNKKVANKSRHVFKINSKRGISAVIGYVLLIGLAITTGLLVYPWFKSLASEGNLAECPDGTSLYVKEVVCENGLLNITLRNNGRFNIAGYFIHGAGNSSDEIATIDLASSLIEEWGGKIVSGLGMVLFTSGNENTFKPGEERTHFFNLGSDIEMIQIVPGLFEEKENKLQFVACSKAQIKELVSC